MTVIEFRTNRRCLLGGLAAGATLAASASLIGSGAGAQTPVASPVASPVPVADLSGVTHRRIETNGIELHIAEAGSGRSW